MFNLLLIRAGSTEYTCQGRVQGSLDVPLSEEGQRQAKLVAEQLGTHSIQVPLDTLFCGPCRASRETAELIGQHLGIKPRVIDLLHNLDLGLWQGMLIEDVKTKQPKVYRQWQEFPETVCPPEGETVPQARDRLITVQAKLAKKYKSGTVAAVLLEPLASLWRNLLLDEPIGDLWKMGETQEALWELIPTVDEPVVKG